MRLPLVRHSTLDAAISRLVNVRENYADSRRELDAARKACDELLRERDETRRALEDTSLRLGEAEAEIASLRAAPDPMDGLTAEDVRDLLDTFKHDGACKTCGGIHVRSCPRVRSVEYDRQGDKVSIRRVDFWRKWDDSGVIFSDMLPDPDEITEEAEPE